MNKRQILVIDDESQIRKLLEITLSTNDFEVKLAENGLEGIRFAATFQPDLIMLDLCLPDVDGQKVLQQLREWYLNPIMILSVKSEESEIVKALDNGANDYFSKAANLTFAICAPRSIASVMLWLSALPVPATGKAVPWSTEVRIHGSPTVTLTPVAKPRTLMGICPWS